MGQIRDRILDEIYEATEKNPKHKSRYEELYNIIHGMNNDTDVYNYINANSSTFTKSPLFPLILLEDMPTFSDALFGQLKTGKVDYDKEFGTDWVNNLEEIPFEKIKYVADKQAVDVKDLGQKMASEALKRRREEIADPDLLGDAPITHKIGGLAMSLFGRRQHEAIKEGKSPSEWDYGGDIGENLLYAMPWGKGATLIGKAGSRLNNVLVNRATQFGLNNVATPAVAEAYDAIVYDNDTDRGSFSTSDVLTGTAVNATTPYLVRGLAMGGKRLNIPGSDMLSTLGIGKTAKELASNAHTPIKVENLSPYVKATERNKVRQYLALPENEQTLIGNGTLLDIASQEGGTFGEKLKSYLGTDAAGKFTYVDDYGSTHAADKASRLADVLNNAGEKIPEELSRAVMIEKEFIENAAPSDNIFQSPDLLKIYDKSPYIDAENAIPFKRALKEESLQNYYTNQVGNVNAEHSDPYTRLPVVGGYISRMMKERAEAEKRKELEQQIIEELNIKYGRGE